ncbi:MULTISPECIES: SusC/RagA family TonB-linked outer membrane protein [Niastella]|uniref:TonB-dependent receptor n=1 Tax=Niastella soli TaxID=2821487 RepID=A0ABS3YLU3_9BACT|nr:TonB-dependent receptor [Niastella soli]MBO9198858.1 TonB-dependent receptor [Niastella soli]
MEKKAISFKAVLPPGRLSLLLLLFQCVFLFSVHAQTTKVTGVVKDEKGAPLSGVSVTVKGTNNGTFTDDKGAFSLNVPGQQTMLVFSLISYLNFEQLVGSRTNINITLAQASNDMNEVVVIGYGGTVKKRDLTGAISSVSAKQIEQRQPVTLFDALQGQAAGVLVTNDNGDPAGQGTIQVRGASTINASGIGPLYVIDGIISENGNFVNPADIENIEVLKDVSSTAIYGARGANGVILITTKKGKEGKPTINVNYYYLVGKLAHKLRTTSADELRYYRKMRGDGNNGVNVDSVNPYLNADNDYQDLLFRTANKQVASLSIGGGQKGFLYYGGINYTDDKSIVVNSWIKRVQSKFNVTYQPTSKLSISNTFAFAWQTGNQIPVGTSARQVFERNPWTSIYRPDGQLAGYVESKRNPVAYAMYNTDLDNNYTAQINTQLNYDIISGLKFTSQFNAQLDNETNRQLTPSILTSGGTGDATGSNSINKQVYWEFQNYLNYKKTIGTDHSFTALLGFSSDRKRRDMYSIKMKNYLSESILTSNAGGIVLDGTGTTATAHSDVSVFSRLGYSYQGKYILQGTWRRDGSSRFGNNNKWGNFFSGSAAWRFTDEDFMGWTRGVLTDGKFRYSIGQAGNDAIGDYASYTVVNFGQEYYNGASAAAPSVVLGNPDIKWEGTTSSNWGLDLSFLKGRLNLTVDYYTKNTNKLLYTSKLPSETGLDGVTVNLGSIQNKGLEFTLSGTVVSAKNFSWNLMGNVAFQDARIKELANHTSFISGNKWLIQEGGRLGDFYVWQNEGVYQWNESNAYAKDGTKLTPVLGPNGTPDGTYALNGESYTGTVYSKYRNGFKLEGGDTEWRDVNNDGIIDEQDKVIAGNALPDYFFGISNTFTYKNFTLNVLVNGSVGNDIYNKVRNDQNANSSTYSPPVWDAALYSWHQAGDISKYPLFARKDTRGSVSNGYNSLYIENGSFIRLSSLRLTYALGNKLKKLSTLRGGSVYVYGSNLLTFTDYSWYDPEFSASGLNIGEDGGKYPKRKEIGIGVNFNF